MSTTPTPDRHPARPRPAGGRQPRGAAGPWPGSSRSRGSRSPPSLDGTSALEALRQAPPPDFVLTDLLLPDLDGREVAREARGSSPAPTIALITGWVGRPRPGRERAWGVDYVFLKPLNVRELLELLDAHAPGRPRT